MIKFRFNGRNYRWNPTILKNNLIKTVKRAGMVAGIIIFILMLGLAGTSDYLTATKSNLTVLEVLKNGGM